MGSMIFPLPLLRNTKKQSMEPNKQYDVIIIGGSFAGMAAAMALGRALRNVLIIDSGNPANKQTPHSHNFLTNDGKTPSAITHAARKELQTYTTIRFLNALALTTNIVRDGFDVSVNTGETFTAKKIILASGIKDIMPAIPGFADCWGISVLHCPYCHGYEVRNKKTGILANGELAYELASLINNWTNDLTVFTNGKSTLSEQQQTKLVSHKINVIETAIQYLEHVNGYIKNIHFNDGKQHSLDALYARLPFEQHSTIAASLGCAFTPEGYIAIDASHQTTIHGVYACGDNVSRMRTVANAVSMGTTTGIMINKAIIEQSF